MTETANPATPTPAPPAAENPQNLATFSQADVDRILKDRLARAVPADYADVKAKADEFDKFQEAQKTASEKQAEAIARAEQAAQKATAEALAYRVAATHQVTPDYFDFLGTGDEATVTGRAERLGSLLAAQAENAQLKADLEAARSGKPSPAGSRPIADLKPGATPNNAPTEDDELLHRLGFGPDV